ncbi:hypothetical protein ACH4SK_31035 [Streptomyces inhibens]
MTGRPTYGRPAHRRHRDHLFQVRSAATESGGGTTTAAPIR